MKSELLTGVALAAALPVHALATGGHYPVDGIDVGEPGDFGVESFYTRFDTSNSEFAVLPAWRPGRQPLELVAGLIRVEEDSDSLTRFEPQLKYQFVPMTEQRWGAAVYMDAGIEDSDFNDLFLNVPLSYELDKAALVLSANVGWLHDRSGDEEVDRLFLGGAFEWRIDESLELIGQIYREGADEELESQLGARWHFDAPLEYVDLSLGRVLSGDDRDWFVTVGAGVVF